VLTLTFGRRKTILTAQSYLGPAGSTTGWPASRCSPAPWRPWRRTWRPRQARFELAGVMAPREGLTWVMGLLAFGTAVMLLFAFSPGMAGVAIAIAARMAFLLILLAAVLPWLGRGRAWTRMRRRMPDDLLPGAEGARRRRPQSLRDSSPVSRGGGTPPYAPSFASRGRF
jgi:hypothetical protein